MPAFKWRWKFEKSDFLKPGGVPKGLLLLLSLAEADAGIMPHPTTTESEGSKTKVIIFCPA